MKKPKINGTSFGSIIIAGERYDHDVLIRLSGKVKKRKKKLSKKHYGTSHTISQEEIEYVYEDDGEILILGTGQSGLAELSPEAEQFLKKQGCKVIAAPTPLAIKEYNQVKGKIIGLFHVTC